jgi:3-phenylpropionate/cinnamic acid dioxygenase small subunit
MGLSHGAANVSRLMSARVEASEADLVDFVFHEARLLDEKRFDEWFALFTDDARYWAPLTRGQPNGDTFPSLFYEDKLLLKLRIERLRSPLAHSQQQSSYSQHVLQTPTVEAADAAANRYLTRTPFLYVETQLDRQLLLAGVVWHQLTSEAGRLRMQLKKLELVNCDAAFPSIELFP